MYKKQAKRFCNTSKNDHAIKYLSLGKNGISKNIFKMNLKFPAHYMDPNDLIILSDLASCLLLNGNASEAFKCAESVLKKVKLSC